MVEANPGREDMSNRTGRTYTKRENDLMTLRECKQLINHAVNQLHAQHIAPLEAFVAALEVARPNVPHAMTLEEASAALSKTFAAVPAPESVPTTSEGAE